MTISVTSELFSAIKRSFESRNTKEFGQLLATLSRTEPNRWITLLHLENVIPEPKSKAFLSELQFLLEALQVSLTVEDYEPYNFRELILPLFTLHLRFASIRDRLEELQIWDEVGARVIYRVAAFLEDQFHLTNKQIERECHDRGYYDNDLLIGDTMPTIMGGVKTNKLAGYEENCENLQLILAYALFKYKKSFFGDVSNCPTPYNDAEFTKLLALASFWRRYEYIWGNFVYLGWHPIPHPDKKDVQLYVPKDRNEYLRYEIAGIRMQEMLSEMSFNGYREDFADNLDKLNIIANSIILPLAGEDWNGIIDAKTLRVSFKKAADVEYAEYELYRHHYESLLDDIQLGSGTSAISWHAYHRAITLLRVISDAIIAATSKQLPSFDAQEPLRRIIVIKKTAVAEILSEILEIEETQSWAMVNALLFKPENKHIEIWDTPLLEIESNRVLFVPALVRMGSPSRAIENIIAQWCPDLFAKRGRILERGLERSLKMEQLQAQSSSFCLPDGRQIECDLVVYWDGYLIFIEAKCTKAIFNAADMFRARDKIVEAVGQLNRRRKLVLENWTQFKLAFSDLALPDEPLQTERIKLIAVTNVLHFTGWVIDDVVITDEFCIQRFFGNADIEVFTRSATGTSVAGVIGHIRKSIKPTVREFIQYLENPPQVKMVRDCLETQFVWFKQVL